jgi:hypothetical protein
VADAPDGIVLERHRDLQGAHGPWARRVLLAAIALVSILGLLNVFGQRPVDETASVPAARLSLRAPAHLRGGLLFSARFSIDAQQDLKKARLVLDQGWAEEMAINTIEPSPTEEASDDGKLAFELGPIPAGKSFVLYMQFQVNPTNVGRRSQDVALFDGPTHLLTLARDVTIYP